MKHIWVTAGLLVLVVLATFLVRVRIQERFEEPVSFPLPVPSPERPLAATYFERPGQQGQSVPILVGSTYTFLLPPKLLQNEFSLQIEPKHEALVSTAIGQLYLYHNNTTNPMTVNVRGKMRRLDVMPLLPIPKIQFLLTHNGKTLKWAGPYQVANNDIHLQYKLNRGEAARFEMGLHASDCATNARRGTFLYVNGLGFVTEVPFENGAVAGTVYSAPEHPCEGWNVHGLPNGGFQISFTDRNGITRWMWYNETNDTFAFKENQRSKFFMESPDLGSYELHEIRRRMSKYHL